MRESVDPLSLKRGDVVYLEVTGDPSASNYRFSVKANAKSWKGNDVYVKVLAEETIGGEKVTAARRDVLGLPVDVFKSAALFFTQV